MIYIWLYRFKINVSLIIPCTQYSPFNMDFNYLTIKKSAILKNCADVISRTLPLKWIDLSISGEVDPWALELDELLLDKLNKTILYSWL